MYEDLDDVAFIGMGGCGMNMLESWLKHLASPICAVMVNRDAGRLSKESNMIAKVFLSEISTVDRNNEFLPVTRDEVKASMDKHMDELTNVIQGKGTVLLLAGLGGTSGTWLSQLILEHLQSMGKHVVTVLTLPFAFERLRLRVAQEALKGLHLSEYLLICSNQDLMQFVPSETSLEDAFNLMHDQLFQAFRLLQHKRFSKGTYRVLLRLEGVDLLPIEDLNPYEIVL